MPENNRKINAVVLAGRRNDGKLKDCDPQQWEALIDIAGKPMVSRVLDGLLGASCIGHIVLVAPEDVFGPLYASERVTVVEPAGTIVTNAVKGCKASPKSEHVLICTSDLPLITSEVIDRFVQQCLERDVDFYYPAVTKEAVESRFPGVTRTYVSIKDGDFTGGNIFLARSAVVDTVAAKAEAFIENRKSPIKQAGVLGWSFIIKLLLHILTIDELESTITRSFGASAAAVITNDPEIGVDVDKPSDYELVLSAFQKTG